MSGAMSAEHAERYRRKLYGRRKGPALSVRQEHLLETLLPKLTPRLEQGIDPRSYFTSPSPPPCGEVGERSDPGGGQPPTVCPPIRNSLRELSTSPQGGGDYNVDDVWLEVGFGAGEHLHWQALHHPRIGLIGAEPFVNGVAKLLSKIEEEPAPNIRLYMDDARDIISVLPDASLGR